MHHIQRPLLDSLCMHDRNCQPHSINWTHYITKCTLRRSRCPAMVPRIASPVSYASAATRRLLLTDSICASSSTSTCTAPRAARRPSSCWRSCSSWCFLRSTRKPQLEHSVPGVAHTAAQCAGGAPVRLIACRCRQQLFPACASIAPACCHRPSSTRRAMPCPVQRSDAAMSVCGASGDW